MLFEHTGVLVLYMGAYLLHKLIVATQNEPRDLGGGICRNDGLYQRHAQPRQAEIEEIGMGVVQVSLQGRDIYLFGYGPLVKDLVIDDREEGRRMYAVGVAHLLDGLVSDTHLEPEAADDLNGIFLMRHEVANLVGSFIHDRRIKIRGKGTAFF